LVMFYHVVREPHADVPIGLCATIAVKLKET
jgi:hypothetical protein